MYKRFNVVTRDDLFLSIDRPSEIVNKALLAHVMNYLARRVIATKAFAQVFFYEILKNLPKHFLVDGYFFFQRLGLVNREVIAVEYVEDACAGDPFFHVVVICEEP